MKLIEALNILKSPLPDGVSPWNVALVCGFTPAHLETFLAAQLRLLAVDRRPMIQSGVYGDCVGNLQRLVVSPPDAAAMVLEWPDLDPRLGLRHLGGWTIKHLGDIRQTVEARLIRISEAVERLAPRAPLALCTTTLPIPPVGYWPGRQAGAFELALRESVVAFAARISSIPGVRIVNPQLLDELSPHRDRLDVRTDLSSGFPYRLAHASAVAGLLARLLWPPASKKGLITDLDDTLWRGILGDVGPDGITWDLDHHSQIHGLYQQLLDSLADAGVLIAVASKNDAPLVSRAFDRADLILTRDRVYPVESGWGPKSQAVARILHKWNISGDAVVFVDDSPMELAEVRSSHPDVECVQFPRDDEQAAYELLKYLRGLFGKTTVTAEDGLRLESLRRSAEIFGGNPNESASPDQFLEQTEAEITVDFRKDQQDQRALELINKTNQFNLNGRRFSDGEWPAHCSARDTFLMVVSYKDKFGPLGKIAVLTGRQDGPCITVQQWVMSCRAFSRRIEHRCLGLLFEELAADRVFLDFQATPRNGPFRNFLADFLDQDPQPGHLVPRETFRSRCPPLHHQVKRLDS
ncbi:MAG: HAD-IIIC family phosphatase [Isosphaeraceae bacterium]